MKGDPRTIKEALHNTIHRHHSLDIDGIAEQLGMAKSYLYRAALPDQDTDGPSASGVRFPLKQLIPLVKVTEDFQVLDYIENSLGRVAINVPTVTSSVDDLKNGAIKASAEFGDLMREISESAEDGELDKRECIRINKEGWEAITAIVRLIKHCENV